MKDKFSYFDLLAYFAPGVFLLWAAQQSLRFVGLSSYFQMENWAYESVVGIVLAFVVGQLISARGRTRFETRSKWQRKSVFAEGLISENYLLKDRHVCGLLMCPEPRRVQLVEMAMLHCDLSAQDAAKLDGWVNDLDAAQETSHRLYRPLLTLLTDKSIGEKAHSMNLRYVFFRNLNVAAAYGALLFFLAAVFNAISGVPITDARTILPSLLAILSVVTSIVARIEAIHSGLNHVREVFDSAHNFFAHTQ